MNYSFEMIKSTSVPFYIKQPQDVCLVRWMCFSPLEDRT